jgi:hypothetical protein
MRIADCGVREPEKRSRVDISHTPGQLLLVVTPGSEPGGRWFDSNPRNSISSSHTPCAIRWDGTRSVPTTYSKRSRGLAARAPGLQPGDGGSTPSGTTFRFAAR